MKLTVALQGTKVTMQHVKVGKRGGHIAWNLPNDGPGGIATTYSSAMKQANAALYELSLTALEQAEAEDIANR